MPADFAFLHTAPVHVPRFSQLLAQVAPQLRAAHVVDEALLADARRLGADDPALVQRVQDAMRSASETHGAGLVACTCSTIGGAAERTPTAGRFIAMRIDRAMADRAVARGEPLLVVTALASTQAPTRQLIDESARAAGAAVRMQDLLVAGAWDRFEQGDATGYLAAIAQAVRHAAAVAAQPFAAVVLAQASMDAAVPLLDDLGLEVLASPSLGLQAIVQALQR